MPIVDGIVVFAAFGLVILAALGIRAARKTVPEVKGAENAEETAANRRRRCQFCNKDTSPDTDLYVNKHWYHINCYNNKDT